MKDINGIARPITYPSFGVLALRNEIFEGFLINPILFAHHAKGGINPPRVANIWKLLGPAVKASLIGLSLAQPFRKQFLVK
jgi:hypothetical protein